MTDTIQHACVDCGSHKLSRDELVCLECWAAAETHQAKEPNEALIQIGPLDI